MKYYKRINHFGMGDVPFDFPYKIGMIYPEDFNPSNSYSSVSTSLKTHPERWQELPEHEWVIQEAKIRYPKGTKFRSAYDSKFIGVSDGKRYPEGNNYINVSCELIEPYDSGYALLQVYNNGKWAEIIKEEEKTMEKEIIGYKLKEDAWNSGNMSRNTWLKTIAQLGLIHNEICDEPNEKEVLRNIFENKDVRSNFEKTGVLDLWFEPVYKESFKVGDWVYIEGTSGSISLSLNSHGDVVQIHELRSKSVDFIRDGELYTNSSISYIKRLATPEEIEKVKNPILTIKGYQAEFFEDCVKFGCQRYLKGFVLQLAKFIKDSGLSIEHKDEIMKVAKYYGFEQ